MEYKEKTFTSISDIAKWLTKNNIAKEDIISIIPCNSGYSLIYLKQNKTVIKECF